MCTEKLPQIARGGHEVVLLTWQETAAVGFFFPRDEAEAKYVGTYESTISRTPREGWVRVLVFCPYCSLKLGEDLISLPNY